MKTFVCKQCGHIEFDLPSFNCPVCGAPSSAFSEEAEALKDPATEGKEKHVPVITVTDACGLTPEVCRDVHVQVGSVPHPMMEDHSITWIDIYINNVFAARYQMRPENLQATVGLHLKKETSGKIRIIENCNKHGRWMAEADL